MFSNFNHPTNNPNRLWIVSEQALPLTEISFRFSFEPPTAPVWSQLALAFGKPYHCVTIYCCQHEDRPRIPFHRNS